MTGVTDVMRRVQKISLKLSEGGLDPIPDMPQPGVYAKKVQCLNQCNE
jgi:hypothetical protein